MTVVFTAASVRRCPGWCTTPHILGLTSHLRVAGEVLRETESIAVELIQDGDDRPPVVTLTHFIDEEEPDINCLTEGEARELYTALGSALRLLHA